MERKLVAQNTDSLHLILDIIRQEESKRKRRTVWSHVLSIFSGFPFWGSVLFGTYISKNDFFVFCFICIAMVLSIMLSFISSLLSRASEIEKNAIRILAQFNTVQAVGPLAEALLSPVGYTEQNAIASQLKALLPHLRQSDAAFLNGKQRHALYRALLNRKDADLVLTILKALEQIGDSQALPYVEILATGTLKTTGTAVGITERQMCIVLFKSKIGLRTFSTKEEQRIKKAAQECLPFLQEQVSAGQQTLLRAADQTAQPTNTLLLPTVPTSDLSPQELLRAHPKEELSD